MVIKDGIADVYVTADAVKVDCGISDVKDEVSKLKFHLDLPSYRLSTNSTHYFGGIFNCFLKKWEEVNSVPQNTVQDSTAFLIFLKRRKKYST